MESASRNPPESAADDDLLLLEFPEETDVDLRLLLDEVPMEALDDFAPPPPPPPPLRPG